MTEGGDNVVICAVTGRYSNGKINRDRQLQLLEMLLERGADINHYNMRNQEYDPQTRSVKRLAPTALFKAVKWINYDMHRRIELVKFLLEHGADTWEMNCAHQTPDEFCQEQLVRNSYDTEGRDQWIKDVQECIESRNAQDRQEELMEVVESCLPKAARGERDVLMSTLFGFYFGDSNSKQDKKEEASSS